MKLAIILAASIGLAIPAAKADDTRIGVGVGPAGVTVGESHDRDLTTIVKEREVEPRERTTIIKREHEEPSGKVIVKEHDRD